MMNNRPIPSPSVDGREFFKAAAEGELRLLRCRKCSTFLHLPRALCRECASTDLEWTVLPGTGRVYSWTVIEHQVHPAFPTPYTVVLVEIDGAPGVRLPAHIAGAEPIAIGDPMQVWFETFEGEELGLPQFQRIPEQVGPSEYSAQKQAALR